MIKLLDILNELKIQPDFSKLPLHPPGNNYNYYYQDDNFVYDFMLGKIKGNKGFITNVYKRSKLFEILEELGIPYEIIGTDPSFGELSMVRVFIKPEYVEII